jgi:hypothetical protein
MTRQPDHGHIRPSSHPGSSLPLRVTRDNLLAHPYAETGRIPRFPSSHYADPYHRSTNGPYPPSSSSSYDYFRHSPSTYPHPPPSGYNGYGRSRRQLISCYPCRARKLKCDGQKPCQQCDRRGTQAECAYADKVKRRGKGRKPEDGKSSDDEAYGSSGMISPADGGRHRDLSQDVGDGDSSGRDEETMGPPPEQREENDIDSETELDGE